MIIPPKVLEYGIILIIVSLLVSAVYYKGYGDAKDKYEKEALVAQIDLGNRISKVEGLSSDIADLIAATSGSTTEKLDTILARPKGKPLTSVPCTPSVDFTTTWNDLNKATK